MKKLKVSAVLLVLCFMFQLSFTVGATTIFPPIGPIIIDGISVTLDPNFDSHEASVRIFSKENGKLPSDPGYHRNGFAFAGWSDTANGGVVYDRGAPITEEMDGATLYAVWCKLCFRSEESFTIRNSSYYFDVNDQDNYYLEEDDYAMMQKNLYKVFLPSPVPETILSVVLSTYPSWSWRGSCYGIASTAALQHEGIIDVVGTQGVQNTCDLEPTDDLISYINYYQSQAATSFLCEHKAFVKGTPNYKEQLRELYDSVSNGNLVLFTFYTGNAFVTPGHTVLFTGAYKDASGNIVFVAYDSNYGSDYYYEYYNNRFTVSPDFSEIRYGEEEIGALNWVDDFTQFSSFDIQGNGNPLNWYKAYFAHFLQLFQSFAGIIRSFIK